MTLTISLDQARAIAIAAQGLDRRPNTVDQTTLQQTIQRMQIVQIDTINVVARAPYFVLWSRLGDYDPAWFDQLQYPAGQLFEYWAHAASFLPIELFPLLRPAMLRYIHDWHRSRRWLEENKAVADGVLAMIRERGPLRSADFEAPADHAGGGWWNWKPAKSALDILWGMGELMIVRREKFQRVYELTERVVPDWDDRAVLSFEAAAEQLSERGLRAMGIATERHLPDYFRQRRPGIKERLQTWAAEGKAIEVQVEGWKTPAYIHHEQRHLLEQTPTPSLTTMLSPFDNLIWDRQRTLDFWQFDYRLECYTPAPKRRYGYFTLPILWKDRVIGRVDAKAERSAGIFRVHALHLEPNIELSEALYDDLAVMLRDCANWHRTPTISITMSDPPQVAGEVQARLD